MNNKTGLLAAILSMAASNRPAANQIYNLLMPKWTMRTSWRTHPGWQDQDALRHAAEPTGGRDE